MLAPESNNVPVPALVKPLVPISVEAMDAVLPTPFIVMVFAAALVPDKLMVPPVKEYPEVPNVIPAGTVTVPEIVTAPAEVPPKVKAEVDAES